MDDPPGPETTPTGGAPGRRRLRRPTRRTLGRFALGIVVGLLAIQLIPYGRDHANPPATATPTWDSPDTERLFRTSCGDCHSNDTRWPWYTNVAPISWLVQRDVDEGRATFNVSEASTHGIELDEIAEVIREGEMPPLQYRLVHRDASLSDVEAQALIDGLSTSLAPSAVTP